MSNDTVGQRLYPVPDLRDVELRRIADGLIVSGLPERIVKSMQVTDLIKLMQAATDHLEPR